MTGPPAEAAVTTGVLARRLGVSPTTLRSWDRRYGLGPTGRSPGGHRRWSPTDIAMAEEMCRLTASGAPPAEAARVALLRFAPGGGQESREAPAPRPPGPGAVPDVPPAAAAARPGGPGGGLPLGDVRQECRGLARSAVRLDAPELDHRLRDAVRHHGLAVAWEEVMVPTLRAVGRKWESSGDRYVEVEHLLSWHISSTLRSAPLLLPSAPPPAKAPPVVLACTPGEQHSLALEALTAALGERGVPTRTLGAAVPAEALQACVRRTGPTAVVLWAQTRSTASVPLARHVAGLQWGAAGARRRPVVLPAGPGWGQPARSGFPHCTGLRDAVAVLSRLYDEDRGARPAPVGAG
ncbi:transcriptional regulator [Streptomyces pluripotens]|uniref:Transcriptional regulator n=1 Tax=Streptomyces pluripotens TaxID=1355015 RepID=A0A221NT69_9ACTN|nr:MULTISPECIES: MerR family transcriptional regulator [Streptomyces]ARP68908.1 transcriptional regulator [Streptomyces pluripotens]ASN23161.1 transcriptional regulator [Streptomyces pluripotens]MCH0556892.1 MerR family transcriptional regulator [Streptomyces sp. MUM 16J]